MKLCVRDQGTKYEHFFAESDNYVVASNEVEVTDISTVEDMGCKMMSINTPGWIDKKCVRDKLKNLIYTKMQIATLSDIEDQAKWDLLSDAEKSIAAHWFFVGKESFLFEVKNDQRYWDIKSMEYRKWTQDVKEKRLDLMEAIVFRRILDVSDSKQVLADMTQIYLDTVIDIDAVTNKLNQKVRVRRIARMYVEGLTNQADDGEAAIRDYINSEAGTPFATNGFRNLTCTFRGSHTADSVADELLTVIDSTW